MNRGLGILTPIFSLPSNYGIGTFGKASFEFVDFLEKSKVKYWQLLPLNPTSYGDSPYQSFSSFALNPYFIDLDILIEQGYLTKEDVKDLDNSLNRHVDYGYLFNTRFKILKIAFDNSFSKLKDEIEIFVNENKYWIEPYALFMTLKVKNNFKGLMDFPLQERFISNEVIEDIKSNHLETYNFYIYIQYLAYTQYFKLKEYANKKGVKIIGDLPIYVALDSADVFAFKDQFLIDEDGKPSLVAGVPPDYFSSNGQLWGNPIYDYKKMDNDDYYFWRQRTFFASKLYDVIRIDHFRGFEAYYGIKYGEKTAINGQWYKGPGIHLLSQIKKTCKNTQFIAEDLGILTRGVYLLKDLIKWPGLVIYEFAYSTSDSEFKSNYLPRHYKSNCVGYIGTHDNDTLKGFLNDKNNKELLPLIYKDLKVKTKSQAFDKMMESLTKSRANLVIYSIQDILKQDTSCRINTPGEAKANWQYRIIENYATKNNISKIKKLVEIGKR